MKKRYCLVVLLILVLPLSVVSTPPSIPFDVFDVRGTLTRAGGSPADHTVVLVRRDYCGGEREWCRLLNCDIEDTVPYGPYTATTLSRNDGRFALRVAVCGSWLDTLAVAAIYPDTMLVGTLFVPADMEYTAITETGRYTEDGFFCDDEEEFQYERARIYTVSATTITVP